MVDEFVCSLEVWSVNLNIVQTINNSKDILMEQYVFIKPIYIMITAAEFTDQ